ncbi:MAG TPA: glycosyl transferase, partial [Rhodospirillum rubrum]|nr:glycosyl transferase [Rhodospirillum rubrum]
MCIRDSPLHVAYLASRYHHALLSGILATHDRAVVVPHLYTDDAEALPPDLRSRVIVHPLGGVDLAASCAANGIDVVVDTVGLHPFHGQAEVLRFLRRRLAPSQWGWFGGWGPGSGLFDGLITDTVALPAAADHHDEDILALAGGQWSWTPPAVAPAIGPLPSAQTGIITFGCAVRGFRISRSCLETWADLLAGMDNARLMILGRQAHDWEFRAGFSRLLQACGIAPERVVYRFQQAYADHLHSFAGIDIALDTFPANGGLCLADALWMGVPVVTLAGTGLLAERQGASLLAAADCGDWIARSPADYLAIARKLAGDRQDLALIRHTLRDRLGASPLLDARRITSQLEAAWLKARDAMAGITAAPDLKSRSQALAKRDLAVWLGRERSLTLPPSQGADDAPDLSVVIVLYNQAGLSLRTLIALADQQGVRFETIIVDNASTDETPALLARVRGATLLRNEDNIGFLRAANQGAAVARGKHIVFLNNDVFLHRDALAAALRRLRADPSIGVVGGRVVLIDGSLQEAGCMVFNDGSTAGYGRGEDPNLAEFRFLREVDYVSGAFLMLPRALWRALGGFEPALAPAYYEDTDLCLRVHRAGFRVVYDPAVVLTHVEGGSTVTSDAAAAMIRRNRGAFLARHAEALRSRPSPAAARPLRDRWAPAPAPRVLVIDNGVPHSAGGAGNPRARLMIEALAGCHVTFFPMWVRESDWAAVYRTLGAEVEVMLDQHATTLEDFLDHRQGLYDVLVVSRPPNMAIVKAIGRRRPDLLKGMRLVYDAEALFALRDIAQAAITARPLPRTEARRRLRDELDLAAGADTVLAVSRREARLFSAGGAAKVHLVSHALPAHP